MKKEKSIVDLFFERKGLVKRSQSEDIVDRPVLTPADEEISEDVENLVEEESSSEEKVEERLIKSLAFFIVDIVNSYELKVDEVINILKTVFKDEEAVDELKSLVEKETSEETPEEEVEEETPEEEVEEETE